MDALKKIAAFILLGFLFAGPSLYAKEDPGTKLGRGLTNIIASPGEYFVQTAKLSQNRDPMTRLFAGAFKGTCIMMERIGVGAYDVLTFPVPFPAEYKPLILPPTVMDEIKEQSSKEGND